MLSAVTVPSRPTFITELKANLAKAEDGLTMLREALANEQAHRANAVQAAAVAAEVRAAQESLEITRRQAGNHEVEECERRGRKS